MTQNQTQTNTENPLGLSIGTTKHKIYQKYFVEQVTNIEQIASLLNLSSNTIKTQLYLIKKMIREGTSAPELTAQMNRANQVLEASVKAEGDELILNIKTCKEFEDYLKANKEVKKTERLWGKNETSKFYHLSIAEGNYTDDINAPVVSRGIFNFAVLRIPGISNGLKFKLDGLLTEEQIVDGLKLLIKAYKTFYKAKISNKRIEVRAEVLAEND